MKPHLRKSAYHQRFQLLLICALIVCTLFANSDSQFIRSITDENDQYIGDLIINQGEEPIDSIYKFCKDKGISIQRRNSIVSAVCSEPTVHCRRLIPRLLSTTVTNEKNQNIGLLELFENEEPADVVYEFGNKYGLPHANRRNILSSLCANFPCSREFAIVFRSRITGEDGATIPEMLEIFEHQEPVDVVYRYSKRFHLSLESVNVILQNVCNRLQCSRTIPLLYSQRFTSATEQLGQLDIFLGQEPADVVASYCERYNLDREMFYRILSMVCQSELIECQRAKPKVFSSNVLNENQTSLGSLEILDGEEAVDAIYRFSEERQLGKEYRFSLLQQACSNQRVTCTRLEPLLFHTQVTNENREVVGDLHVFEGQEPAHVVADFTHRLGLSPSYQHSLLSSICSKINCKHTTPLVFSSPVSNETGHPIGILNMYEGQEPVDAIYEFGKQMNLTKDYRERLLEPVCRSSQIPCTRAKALVSSIPVSGTQGETIGKVYLFEGEEPVDSVYRFGKHHNMSFAQRKALLVSLCQSDKLEVNCTRAEALLLSIPVHGAEGLTGNVEIFEGQEPIDAIYAFGEKHELLNSPNYGKIIEAVCVNSTKIVNCTRMRPRPVLFTISATWYGIPHKLEYVQPEDELICTEKNGGTTCVHYMEILSTEFCSKHMPSWDQCKKMVMDALKTELNRYEDQKWAGKNMYAKLGIIRTATKEEIDIAYGKLVLKYNNVTEPQKYEKLRDAYRILSDPEEKEVYDAPCIKLFGLCAKKQKDGSMTITPDN